MTRKYFPYILLLLAAILFLFIKTHQRGVPTDRAASKITIHAIPGNEPDNFNRSVAKIIYSKHAHCRMDCRHISEEEVKDILRDGKVNTCKIETDGRGTTYPVEGVSEGHHLRIVFAPKGDDAVEVVTCIDLDKDWPCHCN